MSTEILSHINLPCLFHGEGRRNLCCRAEFHIRRLSLLIWAGCDNSYSWNQLSQSRKRCLCSQDFTFIKHLISVGTKGWFLEEGDFLLETSITEAVLILYKFILQCREGELFVKGHLKRGFLGIKITIIIVTSDSVFIPGAEVCHASSRQAWSYCFADIGWRKKGACFQWTGKTKPSPKNLNVNKPHCNTCFGLGYWGHRIWEDQS